MASKNDTTTTLIPLEDCSGALHRAHLGFTCPRCGTEIPSGPFSGTDYRRLFEMDNRIGGLRVSELERLKELAREANPPTEAEIAAEHLLAQYKAEREAAEARWANVKRALRTTNVAKNPMALFERDEADGELRGARDAEHRASVRVRAYQAVRARRTAEWLRERRNDDGTPRDPGLLERIRGHARELVTAGAR